MINLINIVEMMADDEDQEPSPCANGNVVIGHACYCHHPAGPRKCSLYWNGVEAMKTCELFEEART